MGIITGGYGGDGTIITGGYGQSQSQAPSTTYLVELTVQIQRYSDLTTVINPVVEG